MLIDIVTSVACLLFGQFPTLKPASETPPTSVRLKF